MGVLPSGAAWQAKPERVRAKIAARIAEMLACAGRPQQGPGTTALTKRPHLDDGSPIGPTRGVRARAALVITLACFGASCRNGDQAALMTGIGVAFRAARRADGDCYVDCPPPPPDPYTE